MPFIADDPTSWRKPAPAYPEEGGACPAHGCAGTLEFQAVEGCSCHLSAPCGACVNNPLRCNTCAWEDDPPPPAPVTPVEHAAVRWWEQPKPSHDLGGGKRIFDYDYDSRSGSTMVYRGRYEGPVTAADIIALLGDGTFGHRGPTLDNGRFSYTKITD